MSILELDGKFKGLRVKRTIDKVVYQKHFSFRIAVKRKGVTVWRSATELELKGIKAKALAYDKQLMLKQDKALATKTYTPFGGNTNTGVLGISYRIGKDRQGYDVEAFWLNLTHEGKQHSSSVRLANRSWAEGWKLIIDRLRKAKNLDTATYKKLLATMPSEKKIRISKEF